MILVTLFVLCFYRCYSSHFFLILAPLWWFGALGFGVAVLNWFFGIAIFSWWDFGPVVWGQLGFWGPGSLYKHIRLTLGKKFSPESPWGTTFYCLLAASNSISCVLEEIIIYHTKMFFVGAKFSYCCLFLIFYAIDQNEGKKYIVCFIKNWKLPVQFFVCSYFSKSHADVLFLFVEHIWRLNQ